MTLSDQKQKAGTGYEAQIKSYQQYYPFGLEMYGRKFSSGEPYLFGFNGKMNDKEWGNQLIQDYGFRLYNPAICRFLSFDPISNSYPMLTPYQFASNSPIAGIDLDGLELIPANWYQERFKYGNEITLKNVVMFAPTFLANFGATGYNGALSTVDFAYSTYSTVAQGKNPIPEMYNDASQSSTDFYLTLRDNPGDLLTMENVEKGALALAGVRSSKFSKSGIGVLEVSQAGLARMNNKANYSRPFDPNKKALQDAWIGDIPRSKFGVSPDFKGTPYLYQDLKPGQTNIVNITLTGRRNAKGGLYGDFDAANAAAGFKSTPEGYVWHHLDDFDPANGTATMQLVKDDIHELTIPHSGSVKQYELYHDKPYEN